MVSVRSLEFDSAAMGPGETRNSPKTQSASLKNISLWEGLSHILWTIKHV